MDELMVTEYFRRPFVGIVSFRATLGGLLQRSSPTAAIMASASLVVRPLTLVTGDPLSDGP